MEWLLQRPVVIGIAAIGGALSLAAMLLQRRQGHERTSQRLNYASYAFMGASMLLFIVAGLRGPQG